MKHGVSYSSPATSGGREKRAVREFIKIILDFQTGFRLFLCRFRLMELVLDPGFVLMLDLVSDLWRTRGFGFISVLPD